SLSVDRSIMADNSQASKKKVTRKKGDSTPSAGTSSKSKKVKKDRSIMKNKTRTTTPAKTPVDSTANTPLSRRDESKRGKKKDKPKGKIDPEMIKMIREGREDLVTSRRRGGKDVAFVFPPGRIYKHGTVASAVPIVPTSKMK
ncbi:hypothetical protein PFISCL1PPCAC_23485, partial [Pristionchus fissidentatus]